MRSIDLQSSERQTIASSAILHPLAHLDEAGAPYKATRTRVRVDPLDTVNVMGSSDESTVNAWIRRADKDGIDVGNIPISIFARKELAQLFVADPDEVLGRPSSIIAKVRRMLNV